MDELVGLGWTKLYVRGMGGRTCRAVGWQPTAGRVIVGQSCKYEAWVGELVGL